MYLIKFFSLIPAIDYFTSKAIRFVENSKNLRNYFNLAEGAGLLLQIAKR